MRNGNWAIKDFNLQGYKEYNKEQSFSFENYGNYNFLIIDEMDLDQVESFEHIGRKKRDWLTFSQGKKK